MFASGATQGEASRRARLTARCEIVVTLTTVLRSTRTQSQNRHEQLDRNVVHCADNFMSINVSWRHAWRKAISYIYVAYWDRKYFSRVWWITKLFPILLIVLSGLELLGSLLHFVKWLEDETASVRIGIAFVLLIVAWLMVWHHRRLENRIQRHQAIMAMTRVLCTRSLRYYNPNDDSCAPEFIHNTLEAFIYALEHERDMGIMNASLVVRDGPGEKFRILDQYPSGTFLTSVRLDSTESAAAITAAETGSTLVYIPSTKY